eukprot:5439849-Amphidinium_carterae.1
MLAQTVLACQYAERWTTWCRQIWTFTVVAVLLECATLVKALYQNGVILQDSHSPRCLRRVDQKNPCATTTPALWM